MIKDYDAMVSPRCWCHSGGVKMSCTEHLPFLYYGVGLLPGSSLSGNGQLAATPSVIIMHTTVDGFEHLSRSRLQTIVRHFVPPLLLTSNGAYGPP